MNEGTNMNEVIKRLREEKKESDTQCEKRGFQDGMKAAKKLSYDDFQYLALTGEMSDELDEWFRDIQIRYLDPGIDEKMYRMNWIKGALQFWNSIKDQI